MVKQVIVARKDLNMSPGKLSAQVAHGSIAFLAYQIRQKAIQYDDTKHDVYWGNNFKPSDFIHLDLNGVIEYVREDFYRWAKEAAERGEKYFYCRPKTPYDKYGEFELCDSDPYYKASLTLDRDTMENWIDGAYTKIVLQVDSREELFELAKEAREKGRMIEGKDFFIIKDNCWTELRPEDSDGTIPTVLAFRPMRSEVIDRLTGRLKLYG